MSTQEATNVSSPISECFAKKANVVVRRGEHFEPVRQALDRVRYEVRKALRNQAERSLRDAVREGMRATEHEKRDER
jgi:hypothetical protein